MELIALTFIGLFVWLTMAAASVALALAMALVALVVWVLRSIDLQPPKRLGPALGSPLFATLAPALPEIAIVAFAVSLGVYASLPSQ